MTRQEKLESDRKLWKKKVEEFKVSGLTATAFAKNNGISPYRFHYWKDKFSGKTKKGSLPKESNSTPLIKVSVASSRRPGQLPDPQWLAELIKALQ